MVSPISRCFLAAIVLAAGLLAGCNKARSEGEFVEGKPHGFWKYWYANGQREKSGTYKNGVEDGVWTYWYENGQRSKEGAFADGKEQGEWTFWYESGQTKEKGTYDHGGQHGAWVYWHENGQRAQEKNFADGSLVAGSARHWNYKGVPDIDAATTKDIASLVAMMRDRNPSVSAGAMPALERLGIVAVPSLVDLLRDSTGNVRHNALRVLLKLGPKLQTEAPRLVPALIECLGDSDPRNSPLAMQALVFIGPVSVPNLAETLEDGKYSARNWACMTLAEFKGESKSAVKQLVGALYDQTTRTAALDALGSIGEPAVTDLKGVLADSNAGSAVRFAAMKSLGKLGPAAAPAVAPLVDLLADRDPIIRKEAVNCLGSIGEASVQPLMAALLNLDSPDTFRDTVANALSKVGVPAIPPLKEALKHEDREVRFRAAVAIGDIGRPARDALPAIEAARAIESDDNVQRYLDQAIVKINKNK